MTLRQEPTRREGHSLLIKKNLILHNYSATFLEESMSSSHGSLLAYGDNVLAVVLAPLLTSQLHPISSSSCLSPGVVYGGVGETYFFVPQMTSSRACPMFDFFFVSLLSPPTPHTGSHTRKRNI